MEDASIRIDTHTHTRLVSSGVLLCRNVGIINEAQSILRPLDGSKQTTHYNVHLFRQNRTASVLQMMSFCSTTTKLCVRRVRVCMCCVCVVHVFLYVLCTLA